MTTWKYGYFNNCYIRYIIINNSIHIAPISSKVYFQGFISTFKMIDGKLTTVYPFTLGIQSAIIETSDLNKNLKIL